MTFDPCTYAAGNKSFAIWLLHALGKIYVVTLASKELYQRQSLGMWPAVQGKCCVWIHTVSEIVQLCKKGLKALPVIISISNLSLRVSLCISWPWQVEHRCHESNTFVLKKVGGRNSRQLAAQPLQRYCTASSRWETPVVDICSVGKKI